MSFSPIITIAIIFVVIVLVLFLLIYFKKIQVTPPNQVKTQLPSLPPIKPESSPWLITSKTLPLDPYIPPPGPAGCPICQLYTFGGEPFQISQPRLQDLPACVAAGTCQAAECPSTNYPTCLWPDQIFAFSGYHTCGTSQAPVSAGTCVTQTGQNVPAGYVESYYTSCNKTAVSCTKTSTNMTMDLIIINWSYGGMTPGNVNPLSNFFCLEMSNSSTSPQPIVPEFKWEVCDIGANFLPSQLWIISRYSYNDVKLVPDPGGFLMSIMNRDTGQFLMPAGFTPNNSAAWILANIPAGNKTLQMGLYEPSSTETFPGVWWGIYSYDYDFVCPGESSYSCSAPPQIVFIPNYILVPSPVFPRDLIPYLTNSYSLNVTVNREDISGNFTYNNDGTWTMDLKNMGPKTVGTPVIARQFLINRNLTNPAWTQPPVTVNSFLMDYAQYPTYVRSSNYRYPDPS